MKAARAAVAAAAIGLLATFASAGASSPQELPGEATWANGTSSYIFGTNDAIEYASPNVDDLPSVQADLKAAHLTLMRTWAYDTDSDASITQRIATIQAAGMTCMLMLGSTDDETWMAHVVTMLGNECDLYEFGNEPDNPPNDTSIAQVTSEWIADVPQLEAINPAAVFGGPAVTWSGGYDSSAGRYPSDMAYFLANTAAAGVRAGFISYHDYPCQKATSTSDCIAMTPGDFKYNYDYVTAEEQTYYGGTVPTGVSEYNFDPGSGNLYAWGNEGKFMKHWEKVALKAIAAQGMAFANEFTTLNYSGYGELDMFHDSAPYGPKPQEKAMAAEVAKYRP